MTTLFYVLLILFSLLVGAALWSATLKIRRFERAADICLRGGPLVVFVMLFYSVYFMKNDDYGVLQNLFLSLVMTAMLIIGAALMVGVLIIFAVGAYWTFVTLRGTNYAVYGRRVRMDFSSLWNKIKNWVEGEE